MTQRLISADSHIVDEQFRDIPAAETELIVCGNAARIWNI